MGRVNCGSVLVGCAGEPRPHHLLIRLIHRPLRGGERFPPSSCDCLIRPAAVSRAVSLQSVFPLTFQPRRSNCIPARHRRQRAGKSQFNTDTFESFASQGLVLAPFVRADCPIRWQCRALLHSVIAYSPFVMIA